MAEDRSKTVDEAVRQLYASAAEHVTDAIAALILFDLTGAPWPPSLVLNGLGFELDCRAPPHHRRG